MCFATVRPEEVRFGRPFNCPACKALLKLPTAYDRGLRLLAVALGIFAAYEQGLRSVLAFGFGMIFAIPILVALQISAKSLFIPKLQAALLEIQTLGIGKE
jgi:hypothetical protein